MIEKIRKACCEVTQISEDRFTVDAHLKEDLLLDSLTTLELIMEIENVFDIRLDDSKLKELKTFGDVVALIESVINPES
jgi:acyl carrier protein